jgi:hypothetical protein|tara:strand:+ start:25 stop:270 length:246 start_codon:yes stop_codon:yes gene_type:complete
MAKTTVSSGYIAAGAVGVTELAFSDGSAGQFLKTDGSGTLSFGTVGTGLTVVGRSTNTAVSVTNGNIVVVARSGNVNVGVS